MLLRMYLRWGEKRGLKTELIELSDGEVAGIKSATVLFSGAYAYGWLRTETGVHRLVRKSPFDSGNRRHTSFASIFVSAEIDDDIDIEIERSQHQNRDKAWKQLRAKLHERELHRRREEQQALEDTKDDIGWGSQIRSYVLDQSRVKDLRTELERADPLNVLDGDIDGFLEASLKAGL